VLAGFGEVLLDVLTSPREGAQDMIGDSGDVGDPVACGGPLDAQSTGELCPQLGFVQVADGLGPRIERSRVEGRPATVGFGMHEVGDDDVGVQLRVAGA